MVETGGERCREDGNDEISESQKLGENQKHSQFFSGLNNLVRIQKLSKKFGWVSTIW